MMKNIVAPFVSTSIRRYLDFESISMMMHVMVKGSNFLGLLHTSIHCSIHSHVTKPSHGDVGWYIYDTEGQNNGDEDGLKLFRNIISKWRRKNNIKSSTHKELHNDREKADAASKTQTEWRSSQFHFHLNTRKVVKRSIISFNHFLSFLLPWILLSLNLLLFLKRSCLRSTLNVIIWSFLFNLEMKERKWLRETGWKHSSYRCSSCPEVIRMSVESWYVSLPSFLSSSFPFTTHSLKCSIKRSTHSTHSKSCSIDYTTTGRTTTTTALLDSRIKVIDVSLFVQLSFSRLL